MKHLTTLLIALLITHLMVKAQVKIGDNLTNVNANSILELESTTKALLLPRLNQAQIDAMQNVPAGMLVYNSTTNVLNIRTNSGWTTLALAANANSATNPWATNGTTTYTNASKVGVGTSQPSSQLANNSGNTSGSDGQGGNTGSLSWAASQNGYVGQIYNGSADALSNGLVVKVNSLTATALDVSQGSQSGGTTPLLTVKSGGKVGVGTSSPSSQLANNSGNPTDFQGIGGNSNDSFSWASSGTLPSYVAQINNSGAGTARNGMLVKVHSTDATAFAVYQDNLSLITVKADQKVGINKASPGATLDVNGDVSATTFNLGIQYVYYDYVLDPGANVANITKSCPVGTKIIGGGGGHRDPSGDSFNVIVNYSGPDKNNPDTTWRLDATNTNFLGNRTVRVFALCAKVN